MTTTFVAVNNHFQLRAPTLTHKIEAQFTTQFKIDL